MKIIEKIKKILKEDTTDYGFGTVNPIQFYEFYYFYFKVFCLRDDEDSYKWVKYIHTFLVFNGIIAHIIFAFGLYHAIDTSDIVLMAEWGAYIVLFACYIQMLFCVAVNVQQYRNLTKTMTEDFNYVCNDGKRYRERYFRSQIETRKICLLCWSFVMSTGVFMISATILLLVIHFMTRDPAGDTPRPLIYPLWMFHIDFHQTPYFEIFFTYMNLLTTCFTFVYGFSFQTETLWVRQMSAKVDLIKYCIQDLCASLNVTKTPDQILHNNRVLKQRLREIIRHHLSLYRTLQDFANVYKKVLTMEQTILPHILCLCAYGSAEKLESGEFHFVLIILSTTIPIAVLISSYLCTFIRAKIQSISEAAVTTPFWRTGPIVRPYLVLIVQRSMRPLPLQAPGFKEISLQTFSKKIMSAYSMFNALRQISARK